MSDDTDSAVVLLQAMKEEPPPDAKCRDKFLVQSVPVSASDEMKEVSQIVGLMLRLHCMLLLMAYSGPALNPVPEAPSKKRRFASTSSHPPAPRAQQAHTPHPHLLACPPLPPAQPTNSHPHTALPPQHSKRQLKDQLLLLPTDLQTPAIWVTQRARQATLQWA